MILSLSLTTVGLFLFLLDLARLLVDGLLVLFDTFNDLVV